MTRPPVEESCYWLASRKVEPEAPLVGRTACDVAIVGAGFTGLWTASFLKELEPALDVCVLEQRIAAYGASGRNAGILGDTIDHTHELAIAHFGRNTFEVDHRWAPAQVAAFAALFGLCLFAMYGSSAAPFLYFQF